MTRSILSMAAQRQVVLQGAATPDLDELLASLPDQDETFINHMGSFVFDLIFRPMQPHHATTLAKMLAARPQWAHQRNNGGSGGYPLEASIASNRPDLVRVLLDAGALPSHDKNKVLSAMVHAIRMKADPVDQQEVADLLLNHLSSVWLQKDALLQDAVAHSNLGMIRSLLAHGAGFNVIMGNGNPMAAACLMDEHVHPSIQIVKAMLASPGGLDAMKHNPRPYDTLSGECFIKAIKAGNTGVMRLLIDAGCSPNSAENLAPTPLMWAAAYGQPAAISLLLKEGANPRTVDGNGKNAMHHLCNGDPCSPSVPSCGPEVECFNLLLAAGVDPFAKDTEGQAPIDIATSKGRPTLVAALEALACSLDMTKQTSSPPASVQPCGSPGPRL